MKRYIQVRPQGSLKGQAVRFAAVALIVYGLIAHPAEAALIGRSIGSALVALAEAVGDFVQGL